MADSPLVTARRSRRRGAEERAGHENSPPAPQVSQAASSKLWADGAHTPCDLAKEPAKKVLELAEATLTAEELAAVRMQRSARTHWSHLRFHPW